MYLFYKLGKRRLSNTSWKVFSTCFKYLPLTATIGNRIFCVHGGLSPSLTHLSKINEIRRPA